MTEPVPSRTLEYATDPPPVGKPLPMWAWLLAALFFPAGHFIALSAAKIHSWKRGIILSITCYATLNAAVPFLMFQSENATRIVQMLALDVLYVAWIAWGYAAYRIGQKAHYWSAQARRLWRMMAWIGAVMLILSMTSIVVTKFLFH